jgi:hypothetical protein
VSVIPVVELAPVFESLPPAVWEVALSEPLPAVTLALALALALPLSVPLELEPVLALASTRSSPLQPPTTKSPIPPNTNAPRRAHRTICIREF